MHLYPPHYLVVKTAPPNRWILSRIGVQCSIAPSLLVSHVTIIGEFQNVAFQFCGLFISATIPVYVTATGLAIGGEIGPVVTAMLVSFVHWRWLFCLPLLLILTLPLYRKYLGDEQEGKGGKLDWIGGGLLACTIAGFIAGPYVREWDGGCNKCRNVHPILNLYP